MEKRIRTKTKQLCYQANPNGVSHQGEAGKLYQKFQKGTITDEELRAYAFMSSSKRVPTGVITSVFGKEQAVSMEEYKSIYRPLGYTIIRYTY